MSKKPQKLSRERRQHPRYGFQVDVTYRNVGTTFSAVTGNVSKGGCFIQTDKPLSEGTPIWLEFSFEDIPVRLGNILGRVAWATWPGDAVQGMGVQYEKVPDIVEELMEEFIEFVKNAGKPERTNCIDT